MNDSYVPSIQVIPFSAVPEQSEGGVLPFEESSYASQ